MNKRDNGNKENRSGPGLLGIVLGVVFGFLAGWLIYILYAPIGFAAGIFLGTIYNNWKMSGGNLIPVEDM